MKSSIDSRDRSEMLTRRTATVTISAPEASCACTITALEGYLPVPTIRRDVKVRPARTKASIGLASTHEVHDLDFVAVVHDFAVIVRAADDHEVALDRHLPRVDADRVEQRPNGHGAGQFAGFAVQENSQGNVHSRAPPDAGALFP